MKGMSNFSGKTALITGASSGMGMDYARQLCAAGANLILTARREDRLEALKQELAAECAAKGVCVDIHVFACDLVNEASRESLIARIADAGLKVDILINNAGLGLQAPYLTQQWDDLHGMMQLDMNALSHLTHHYAADMKDRGEGYILLVASVAGHMAIPGYAAYSACKYYVRALGYALNGELRNQGIRVTVVSPGATETAFFEVAGHERNWIARFMTGKSEHVVCAALKGLRRGKREIVPGTLNWLATFYSRLLPYGMMRRIMEVIF